MQLPPLTFTDLSLLLTLGAIILLMTAAVTSPHYGLTNLTINRKKLQNAVLAFVILFLIIVAIRAVNIIV